MPSLGFVSVVLYQGFFLKCKISFQNWKDTVTIWHLHVNEQKVEPPDWRNLWMSFPLPPPPTPLPYSACTFRFPRWVSSSRISKWSFLKNATQFHIWELLLPVKQGWPLAPPLCRVVLLTNGVVASSIAILSELRGNTVKGSFINYNCETGARKDKDKQIKV